MEGTWLETGGVMNDKSSSSTLFPSDRDSFTVREVNVLQIFFPFLFMKKKTLGFSQFLFLFSLWQMIYCVTEIESQFDTYNKCIAVRLGNTSASYTILS